MMKKCTECDKMVPEEGMAKHKKEVHEPHEGKKMMASEPSQLERVMARRVNGGQ